MMDHNPSKQQSVFVCVGRDTSIVIRSATSFNCISSPLKIKNRWAIYAEKSVTIILILDTMLQLTETLLCTLVRHIRFPILVWI